MQQKRVGKSNPMTLGLLFMIVGGVAFFVWGLPPLKYANESKNWPSVSGKIIQSDIDTWRKDGKSHYRANIIYTYTVDSKTFTSSKVTVGDLPSSNNMLSAKAVQVEYPVDNQVVVYYDPKVPVSSALKPGVRGNDIMLAGIPGLFLFIGVLVLFSELRLRIKNKDFINSNTQ
jgi:hypothetical protein